MWSYRLLLLLLLRRLRRRPDDVLSRDGDPVGRTVGADYAPALAAVVLAEEPGETGCADGAVRYSLVWLPWREDDVSRGVSGW